MLAVRLPGPLALCDLAATCVFGMPSLPVHAAVSDDVARMSAKAVSKSLFRFVCVGIAVIAFVIAELMSPLALSVPLVLLSIRSSSNPSGKCTLVTKVGKRKRDSGGATTTGESTRCRFS